MDLELIQDPKFRLAPHRPEQSILTPVVDSRLVATMEMGVST